MGRDGIPFFRKYAGGMRVLLEASIPEQRMPMFGKGRPIHLFGSTSSTRSWTSSVTSRDS